MLAPLVTSLSRDHPRVCGEQRLKKSVIKMQSGSSPRVRGAGRVRRGRECPHGIIPACAGSSHRRCNQRGMARDHPRVCGEQLTVAVTVVPVEGSSPRVRGAAEVNGLRDKRVGIIPACAGSSHLARSRRPCTRDHPRVCGEQRIDMRRIKSREGSSPRVRGAAARHISHSITPVDHPRVCGEQRLFASGACVSVGSSPRVRGAG